MRRIMVVMLAVVLLIGVGYAMAQETAPKPGDHPKSATTGPGSTGETTQPPVMGQGSMAGPQLMQQMQDTMQQMQGMMRKPKVTTAEMKQLQDMLNQMQSMMNQMQISTMMQMCGSCPMMKQTPPTSSTPPGSPESGSSAPAPPPGPEKK